MEQTKIHITGISSAGGRVSVAFKGCPLRCGWCITPEAQKFGQEIAFDIDSCVRCGACTRACGVGMQKQKPARIYDRSFCTVCCSCVSACPKGLLKPLRREVTAEYIIAQAKAAGKPLLLTGGEPTAQPQAFRELLLRAAEAGVETDIHTCGVYDPVLNADIVSSVRTVYFDIKELDPAAFAADTRGDLGTVLSNMRELDRAGADIVIRCTLIPGVNLNGDFIHALGELAKSVKNCARVELAPYSDECVKKARLVDIYRMPRFRVPSPEELRSAAATLKDLGVRHVSVI
ncbi:MAG: radical SAM protein [Clostridia bacterium]|nr:radical SAM protein [Clostridia bacterium]